MADTVGANAPGPALGTIFWTCPIHPQIHERQPGACPICGMALEPEEPSAEEAPNPDLINFTRRLWVSIIMAVPLLILTMGTDMLGLHLVDPAFSPWLQLALAAPIVIWAGAPFFVRGWASVINRRLNMFTLVSIGVGAAFVYSLVARERKTPFSFPRYLRTLSVNPRHEVFRTKLNSLR